MELMRLERSELLTLMDLMGIDAIVGLEPEHLPAPEPFERTITLDDGRSRLLEQGRLSVAEDHYEIDRELEAMMAVIVDPRTVLRISRSTPDSDEAFWCWYFASDKGLVQLAAVGPELFELGHVSDIEAVIAQIGEILPVEPTPDAEHYRVIADQEDADLVRMLVHDWDEVPALSIMEADGLASAEAIEFYDDLTEPRWRGRIDFIACSSGTITVYHRLLVLQGQELSWLAWQEVPGESDLHIQTATAGAFNELLMRFLATVIPK